MLIGAGIGAVGSMLGGRSPIKGAATGAALGAAGGAFQGMMPASFGLKSAGAAAGGSTIGGNMLEPTLAPIGMANSFNMATNAPLPAIAGSSALGTAPLITSTAPSMGGMLAQNSAEVMPSAGFNIGEYLTPQNMLGAALVAGQGGQPQQQVQAPSGGMSAGKAPSMDAITSLLATNRIPERQRRMNLFA